MLVGTRTVAPQREIPRQCCVSHRRLSSPDLVFTTKKTIVRFAKRPSNSDRTDPSSEGTSSVVRQSPRTEGCRPPTCSSFESISNGMTMENSNERWKKTLRLRYRLFLSFKEMERHHTWIYIKNPGLLQHHQEQRRFRRCRGDKVRSLHSCV